MIAICSQCRQPIANQRFKRISNAVCFDCKKERRRLWCLKNRDKINQRNKERYYKIKSEIHPKEN